MKYWLSRRSDPHSVYKKIFNNIQILSNATVVSRWGSDITSSSYTIRLILAIAGDIFSIFQCIFLASKFIVVREFSAWIWLLFAPFVRIFKPSSKIYLNINHNLNNRFERELALPILSIFFRIAFIEPSCSTLQSHAYLTPLHLVKNLDNCVDPIKRIYFFLGTRPEQIFIKKEDLDETLEKLSGLASCVVCGGANNLRLSNEVFAAAFSPGALIVVLYKSGAYTERHSGVVLESIVSSCPVVMFKSDLSQSYIQRGFNVHAIDSIDQLQSKIHDLILIR